MNWFQDRFKIRTAYQSMSQDAIDNLMSYINGFNEMKAKDLSLDTLPCAKQPYKVSAPAACKSMPITIRNDDMYVEQAVTVTEKTEETARRKHFLNRAEDIASVKKTAAKKHFYIDGDIPQTSEEIVEWIKAGKYTLDENAHEVSSRAWDHIIWKEKPADRKSYDAAKEKLEKLLTSTKDAIWAETDFSKIPALLAKFEEKTIH